MSIFKDSTETSCEKCNSKAFGEIHDPANLVRRSADWATKTVAESVSWVLVYMRVNGGNARGAFFRNRMVLVES